nr:hypothetical protein [Tanacetum cinerariifolium]
MVYGMVTNMSKVDKIKAKWTKPGMGMKRVQEIETKEVMNNNHNQELPPQNGPPPMVRPNGKAPRTMEELCQPSINGRGELIAPIPIQAIDFGLQIRDETSRNISSTSTTESLEVVRQLEMMNKNFSETMRQFQMIKVVDTKFETCGGPHSFTECPAVGGYTQETPYAITGNYNSGAVDTKFETCGGPHSFTECPAVGGYTQETPYAITGNYNSGGNSYQPQGDRNLLSYRSNNYLGPPGFNQQNVQN